MLLRYHYHYHMSIMAVIAHCFLPGRPDTNPRFLLAQKPRPSLSRQKQDIVIHVPGGQIRQSLRG